FFRSPHQRRRDFWDRRTPGRQIRCAQQGVSLGGEGGPQACQKEPNAKGKGVVTGEHHMISSKPRENKMMERCWRGEKRNDGTGNEKQETGVCPKGKTRGKGNPLGLFKICEQDQIQPKVRAFRMSLLKVNRSIIRGY
ncbi:MAG TPA: hypothetical protein PLF96_13090, partial [Thermotogota bacterium]|nr:hypothetical protein [Thermotogota bacterium]